MAREFKFRLWDGKSMYYNTDKHTVWAGGVEACVTGEDIPHKNVPYRYTMQFTGLKDKNGKEIYEGDIVLIEHGGEKTTEITYFMDGYFGWGKEHLGRYYFDPFGEEPFEVVGNIYENPELLKEVQ